MEWDRWRARWSDVRLRSRIAAGGAVIFLAAAFAGQTAPYAQVRPGPTPDLTAAVVAAQGRGHSADPQLGTSGKMLATTIDAQSLTWFDAARCGLSSTCQALPVDTSDSSVRVRAADQMSKSIRDAAAVAQQLVGASSSYPSSVLNADLGEVGGPSAGLMLTLTFIDALTPGDLTGGRVLAGTGTIEADGTVGPISGIDLKVAGARQAGAEVFFAPKDETAAAAAAAPAGLTVVSVSSAADALRWLCGNGGHSTACAYYRQAR